MIEDMKNMSRKKEIFDEGLGRRKMKGTCMAINTDVKIGRHISWPEKSEQHWLPEHRKDCCPECFPDSTDPGKEDNRRGGQR